MAPPRSGSSWKGLESGECRASESALGIGFSDTIWEEQVETNRRSQKWNPGVLFDREDAGSGLWSGAERFWGQTGHSDSVVVPPESVIRLASTDTHDNQAFW